MVIKKKHFTSVILAAIVLLAGVIGFFGASLSAPSPVATVHAEIPSSNTGFTPTRDASEAVVYELFQQVPAELTAGKEIMYIAGMEVQSHMIVPKIPDGSATLKITNGGLAYNKTNITCYVDVKERGNGFDYCECGTLNNNATEYNCCYGGVQHYKGAPFSYTKKFFYSGVQIGVYRDDVVDANTTVQLYDGENYFNLTYDSTAKVYKSERIYVGNYEIVVGGVHTGKAMMVNIFALVDEGTEATGWKYVDGEYENGVYYGGLFSGMTYTDNIYFYDMTVKTTLDGALSNAPGEVYLKSDYTNVQVARTATGVYNISYIMNQNERRETYKVIVGGKDTGKTLCDSKTLSELKKEVTIEYYTMKVTLNADSAWTNARVELRDDNGDVRSILNYTSKSGNSTVYTNIMQKDEEGTPVRMTAFVDYDNTGAVVYATRSGAMGAAGDNTFTEVSYYDSTITLKLDNGAFKQDVPVSIANASNTYSLRNNTSTGVISQRIRKTMNGNTELPYTVTVSGTTDNLSPLTISSTNKNITYQYRTVKFFTYTTTNNADYSLANYRTQYVRQGSKAALVADPQVSGMTFDKWSLTTWSQSEDLDSITEYAFPAVTAATNLYPHFAKTEVKTNNSFVKCSVTGTESSTGVAFRMANVTISGFEKGNDSIKSILLNLVNVEGVYFYSTSGKTYKQGQNANLSTVSGGYYATSSSVSITFNNKVSMAVAQDYLRNNVVFKPIVNQDVEVTLTVSDGVLSTSNTTTVSQAAWGGTQWTVLNGTYGSTLSYSDARLYFTANTTITGSDYVGALRLTGNSYMYIPSGVTVTVNGKSGYGTAGGAAGVYLPSGSNLYVFGGGTLNANGGNAGNGSNGGNASNAYKSGSSYTSGKGGNGGAGGGGAGAGIGTDGANGGTGGSGGAAGTVGWSSKGTATYTGKAGSAGSNGGSPAAAGNLYVQGVTINANGGAAGSNGSGGSGSSAQTDKGTGWKYNHCAAGGGGGGGGGGGFAGNNIGAGGQGGGGGGGGGSGACDWYGNTKHNHYGGGYGGYGGYGATGQAGNGGNATIDRVSVPGGAAGGAGSAGTSGSAKSASNFTPSTSTGTKWTVTFSGATLNATQEYSFTASTITVPDYVPTGKNLFLGWRVKTYAKNAYGASASRPLTSAESTLYQPGATITTALGTYGNIVLQAVTMPFEGKIAQDKLQVAKRYFATSNPTKPSYQDYKIQTYLDGVKADVGTMTFVINNVNYKVESSAASVGLYSLRLETNVSTFTAKYNGATLTGTFSRNTVNSVNFESLNVKVTGKANVQSVLLTYNSANVTLPTLKKGETTDNGMTTVFTAIKQKGVDTKAYGIIVDSDTSDKTAKFGATTVINYSTTFATVITNMTIEKAELVGNDKIIPMMKNGDAWAGAALLDNKTYRLYINGYDTGVDSTLSGASVEISAKIYEIKLVTRIDGVVSAAVANLTVNDRPTVRKEKQTQLLMLRSTPASNEYYSYVVLSEEEVKVYSNGTEVTSVTPNSELDDTYVDYYTVSYELSTGSSLEDGKSLPTDSNIYLSGQEATVLSAGGITADAENAYIAGWKAADTSYLEGDSATVNQQLVMVPIVSKDLLKVHYIDYYKEVEVKSRLQMAEQLMIYDGADAATYFFDYGREYELIGWVLDIDESDTIYTTENPATGITVEKALQLLGCDNEHSVDAYFTAVYRIKYLNGLHFELGFGEDDPENTGVVTLSNIGDTFTINYKVTVNDGVNALLLIPEYDTTIFKLISVTTDDNTLLGEPTNTATLDGAIYKIAFDNTELYSSTGEILLKLTFQIIKNVAGRYEDFGFVLDYPTTTLETVDNLTRSNAWAISSAPNQSAVHREVKIYIDNTVAVVIMTPGEITIAEQSVVYHAAALTAGNVYTLAEEYVDGTNYYVFVGGEFVLDTTVTADDFAVKTYYTQDVNSTTYSVATKFDDSEIYYTLVNGEYVEDKTVSANSFKVKHYYIQNTLDDVLYNYSGYAQQADSVTKAVITVKWYTYENGVYTEIAAPKNVGDYYVGVSATKNDFVYAVEEVKGLVHITPAPITYTIDDKTSEWSKAIAELTGAVTEGTLYEGDELGIVLSTTATSSSDVGEYPITGTSDNANYAVTFVEGVYTITKLQIELGLDATAKFEDNSFEYDGTEKQISVTIAEFYQPILSITYTGGEEGCAGNGAIHVRYNENEEVIGYDIVAKFTINQAYIGNCEFVKDDDSNDKDTLAAVLTIVINGISKEEFESLIEKFVVFSVVDNNVETVLTPDDDYVMTHEREYDGNYEYAKVVVYTAVTENEVTTLNDKISAIITYKLNDLESEKIDASTAYDYSAKYSVKDAYAHAVKVTFVPGNGYAFEAEVTPIYTINMPIARKALTITASSYVEYSDEAPEITVDEGTNAWIDGENYETYSTSAAALKGYVASTYTLGMTAGTAYALRWCVPAYTVDAEEEDGDPIVVPEGDSAAAKAAIESILYNYDVTLVTEEDLTVQKKIIYATDYEYDGYAGTYDGQGHTLVVTKDGETLTSDDEIVTYVITLGVSEKDTVKNVTDSNENYTATITLNDTANYIFAAGSDETNDWTFNDDYTVISKAAVVDIAPAELDIEVEYPTKSTATYSLDGFVDGEDESVLSNLTFYFGITDRDGETFTYTGDPDTVVGDTITATANGNFKLSATSSNVNYVFVDYILVVYKVTFADGSYDEEVAGAGVVPQNMPEAQYIFAGLDGYAIFAVITDTEDTNENEADGTYTADAPTSAPTLRHYTFGFWAVQATAPTQQATAFDFDNTIIESDVTIYAYWTENPTYNITYMYRIDEQSTWNELEVVEYYTDDQLVYGDTLSALAATPWFIVDSWYTDQGLSEKFMNRSYLVEDTTLYGHYRFDIGIGDVNADGDVNANDITLYRKWIVGGYPMTVIAKGNEWATVTGETFDAEGVYFVKRVADANAATAQSVVLGDNSLDIRDVSTIRMGMVGGYGFDIESGVEVTNKSLVIISVSEIHNVSTLINVINAGKKAKFSADIEETTAGVNISGLTKDVLIDLNGKTLNVSMFKIALHADYDGTIVIKNGTIIATGGINFIAASGNVILDNVTLIDDDGEFTLQAANNSLHFKNAVKFLKGNAEETAVPASITIPASTHVVIEKAAQVTYEAIDVTPVTGYTLTVDIMEDAPASENEEVVVAAIEKGGIIYRYTTLEKALAAADENATITLVDDVTLTATLNVNKNVTLDLGDYTIYGANADGAAIAVAEGATLNVYAENGGVRGGGEANCKAIAASGTLNIYGGNYSVGPDADGVGNSTIYAAANSAIINIYGGNYSTDVDWNDFYYVLNQWNSAPDSVFAVYGGTFAQYDPAVGDDRLGGNFLAEGYVSTKVGDNYVVEKGFAKIGEVYYLTLQEAIDAAESGDTITLVDDVTDGTGITTRDGAGKTITIDFGGYTYTVAKTTVGSTGTETQAMHWSKGSVVTLRNGTIKAAANVDRLKMAMQNHGTLTIDNMTMDFANIPQYFYGNYTGAYAKYSTLEVPSFCTNSTGFITINNSTLTFNAASAFGVYVESSATISGSTINGTVALSTDNTAATSTATITGSTVSGGVVAYFAGDYILSSGNLYTVRKNGTDISVEGYVAKIGKSYFDNLINALANAQDGDTIELLDDVDSAGQAVSVNKNVTLDLNGYTISNTVDIWNDSVAAKTWSLISVQGGSLTITGNGTLDAKEDDCYAIDVRNGATLTIENGSFVGNISAVYVHEGKLYVNGGEYSIKQKTNGEGEEPYRFTLNCYDASREAGEATITVIGGTFDHFNPANNAAEGAHTNFLAEGYTVYLENGKYIVVNATVATLSEMVTAMQNGYSKVVLGADLSYNGMISFSHDVTLDLNGHTLRSANSNALGAVNGATLTINGNGNVNAQEVCVLVLDGSKAIINGGTYTTVDNFVLGTNGTSGRGGNTIIVNGGTFNGNIATSGYVACGIYVANNDTVTVDGGTFNITNGVGILARSGNTTVGAGATFYVYGDGTLGKVGDSKVTVPAGEVLVVDYAANYPGGTPTLTNNSNYAVYALVSDYASLTAAKAYADKIVLNNDITTNNTAPISFNTTIALYLNNHKIESMNDVALRAIGANAQLTIYGEGDVVAQEACVMAFDGAKVVIEGGTYTANDNFVLGTNGTAGRGGNTITVNGGVFYGNIQSAGYVACGIYVANDDTVTVDGGTFHITNGVGILARSGNTTIGEGVIINAIGDGTFGKVGDSKVTVPSGEEIVLDLAAGYPGGTPTLTNNSEYAVYTKKVIANLNDLVAALSNGGDYTLTANVVFSGQAGFRADTTLNLNGYTIQSTDDVALSATNGATLTINGNGNVKAQEACVMAFDGSTVIINGGTYTSIDNFVLGTNGTAGRGGNTITVNGGTFNGGIVTAGYVACGIYVANNDIVTVNGGTFNITNGVGILARSGNTTVGAGATFNVTGDGTPGKVGDSRVVVPAGKVLVVDYAANYPGGAPTLTNNSAYEVYIVAAENNV